MGRWTLRGQREVRASRCWGRGELDTGDGGAMRRWLGWADWEEGEEKVTWVGWAQTCVFWHQTDLGFKPSSAISAHILNLCTFSSRARWL